jgi:hypothetical protein
MSCCVVIGLQRLGGWWCCWVGCMLWCDGMGMSVFGGRLEKIGKGFINECYDVATMKWSGIPDTPRYIERALGTTVTIPIPTTATTTSVESKTESVIVLIGGERNALSLIYRPLYQTYHDIDFHFPSYPTTTRNTCILSDGSIATIAVASDGLSIYGRPASQLWILPYQNLVTAVTNELTGVIQHTSMMAIDKKKEETSDDGTSLSHSSSSIASPSTTTDWYCLACRGVNPGSQRFCCNCYPALHRNPKPLGYYEGTTRRTNNPHQLTWYKLGSPLVLDPAHIATITSSP